jgi:hypothetical protein
MIAMVKCRIDASILPSASVIIEVGHEIRKNEGIRDLDGHHGRLAGHRPALSRVVQTTQAAKANRPQAQMAGGASGGRPVTRRGGRPLFTLTID